MPKTGAKCIFLVLVAAFLLLAAGCEPSAGKGLQAGKGQAELTGNPVVDAGNAAVAGDFRFKAVRDEFGTVVIPAVSRSRVEGFGYDYRNTLIYTVQKGSSAGEKLNQLDKVYYYAASYNTTLLNYMKDHPIKM